jgi:hypothetical protein
MEQRARRARQRREYEEHRAARLKALDTKISARIAEIVSGDAESDLLTREQPPSLDRDTVAAWARKQQMLINARVAELTAGDAELRGWKRTQQPPRIATSARASDFADG